MEHDRADSVLIEWHQREIAEDAMLRHVKEVAERISRRVRNVLGEEDFDELLNEPEADATDYI